MNKVKAKIKTTDGGRMDSISLLLYVLYFAFLVLSVWITVRIIRIQTTYEVNPRVIGLFRPVSKKVIDYPSRGAIIAEDGRLLAISTPLYQIYMDCSVQKEKGLQDAALEAEWLSKAKELSKGLSEIYQDRSAEEYYHYILTMRDKNKQYVKIGNLIGHETLKAVQALPLYREGRYKGGLIVEKIDTRQYPYGSLARRTIGYVKDNSRALNGNSRIGIEGAFDYDLHGQEGYEWLRVTDDQHTVHNYDSLAVKAEDGKNVRTTLNVDFQDIADRAVRHQIEEDERIKGACAILMEVSTGAIRAMVNLQRESPQDELEESINLAIRQSGEPGSVFKTVTLMSLIEDGYVSSLEQTIPTNHGHNPGGFRDDSHIAAYEWRTGRNDITVKQGFAISSNYVFTYLATHCYGSHPGDFFDKIYSYQLGDKFDFDIEGLAKPYVNRPGTPGWNSRTLGTTAYGYSISVTPLHIAAFYNAIANKGLMMKPYLVESVEKDDYVKEYGPAVLSSICSKATADTLTKALLAVTEEGTGKKLRNTKATIAGKTGTAQVVLAPEEHPRKKDPYHDIEGKKKNQGTFVGFFPAEKPAYTVLVSVYSFPSHKDFYGGNYPALAVEEIVNTLYTLSPDLSQKEPLRLAKRIRNMDDLKGINALANNER